MPKIGSLLAEGSVQIVKSHLRKIVEIYDQEWVIAHELCNDPQKLDHKLRWKKI